MRTTKSRRGNRSDSSLPGQEKLWRLDLHPETVVINKQKSFTRRALGSLYPCSVSIETIYICCGSDRSLPTG